jgi:hypothetical protein
LWPLSTLSRLPPRKPPWFPSPPLPPWPPRSNYFCIFPCRHYYLSVSGNDLPCPPGPPVGGEPVGGDPVPCLPWKYFFYPIGRH